MEARKVARQVVKPVVGEGAWQFLRDLDQSVRQARSQRQRRAHQRAAEQPQVFLSEEQVVARAAEIEADRQRRRLTGISKDLTALAKHFNTDKWGAHRYTPHYQRHLEHLRDQPIRLLEIGIGGYSRSGQGGASLRMWKHFFPKGEIAGLDIEDKSHAQEERIRVFQGDQSDPALLQRIHAEAGPFDVIIDDGSHRPEHILATFEVLFRLLAEGGVYVVEDTQTSYWPEWGGSEDLDAPTSSMTMLKRLCDGLNYEEFVDESYQPTYTDLHVVGAHFYHNLVFVEKGENREGTRRRKILRKRYAATDPGEPASEAAS